MPDLNTIADDLSALTVMEAANLAKMLEERWGVSAAAPVIQSGAGPAVVAEKEPEKTEFDVVLTGFGDKKVDVVKALRAVKPELGLKDAMAAANAIPYTIKEAADKTEAGKIKNAIEAAGGTVEVK